MTLLSALDRVLELSGKATEGPWRWSENGNILGHMPDGYDDSREVCAVYTDHEETGEPNAPAIIAAMNFLREFGPGLREVVASADVMVWRCSNAWNNGDGSVTGHTKYAKTKADMLILRDKGYNCVPVKNV